MDRRPADPLRRGTPSVLVLVLALGALASTLGAQAPAARLPGLDSGELLERELREQDTVLIFWASWSPRCRDIVQRVNAIERRWGSKARVVTINFQEDRPAIRAFLEGKDLKAPVYLDRSGSFSKRLAVTTLPGLVVYRGGKETFRGRLPADPERALEQALR